MLNIINILFPFSLQNSFIDELLQLIGEDDVRVREHASKCLCRFILQNAKHQPQQQQQHQQQQREMFSSPSTHSSSSTLDYNNEKDVHKTYSQNLKLLINFLDYSIFNDMSPALRYVFNSRQQDPQQQQQQQQYNQNPDILTSLDDIMMGSSAAATSSSSSSSSFNKDLPKRSEMETVLAKVLYRLTNRLMSLKDKNMQVKFSMLKHFSYFMVIKWIL